MSNLLCCLLLFLMELRALQVDIWHFANLSSWRTTCFFPKRLVDTGLLYYTIFSVDADYTYTFSKAFNISEFVAGGHLMLLIDILGYWFWVINLLFLLQGNHLGALLFNIFINRVKSCFCIVEFRFMLMILKFLKLLILLRIVNCFRRIY